MKPFTSLLNEMNEKLDLPQPTRSRIILEIAADMEDAYDFYLEQGLEDAVAIEKVKEKFDFNQESLESLVAIHTPMLRHWIDRAVAQFGTRWEKSMLALVVLFIAAMSGQVFVMTPVLYHAGHSAIPILAVGFLGLALSVRKVYQIALKKSQRIQQLRHGLEAILFLSVSSLVLGIWTYFYQLLQAGKLKLFLDYKFLVALRTDYADEFNVVAKTAGWLLHSSSMIMLSMLISMLLALIWFILENKVSQVEQAEFELLLLE